MYYKEFYSAKCYSFSLFSQQILQNIINYNCILAEYNPDSYRGIIHKGGIEKIPPDVRDFLLIYANYIRQYG